MFWKLALGLGFFGLVVSVILIFVFARMFYGSGFQSNDEDLAFGGFLIGILLLIVSLLVTLVSVIFVLRSSKRKWDAANLK